MSESCSPAQEEKEVDALFSFSKFFKCDFPVYLVNWFQWFLILQKLFNVGSFSSLTWFQILIPTWIKMAIAIVWPVSKSK